MSRIRVSFDIEQQEIVNVQKQFLARGEWAWDHEIYRSPDDQHFLELWLKEEKPFGPKLFAASVVSKNGDRFNLSQYLNLSRRRILSAGCYSGGIGDPWCPDSSQIVLFQADITERKVNTKAAFVDVAQRKWIEIADSQALLFHHMWSPSGKYYLYRSLDTWYLLDHDNGVIRPVGKIVGEYFRHCYLVSDEYILLLEGVCKVLSTDSLDIIWEQPLPEDVGARDYSFIDPTSRRVFVGVNPSLPLSLTGPVTASR